MSIGSIFKKLVKDLLSDATNSETTNANMQTSQAYAPAAASSDQYAPDADGHYEIFGKSTKSHDEWVSYFRSILSACFADCSVECEVPASMLKPGADSRCKPVSFLLKRNGRNALAIMLVTTKSYRWYSNLQTEKICSELGVPVLRFYEQCENKSEYVVDRIRKAL